MLSSLSYKTKVTLLTLVPLIIAILAISATSTRQTNLLTSTQVTAFENELLNLKKEELKNYMGLAYSAIKSTYENKNIAERHAKQEVYDTIKSMEFGKDGYFFIYDYKGNNIAHPRKPELEGKNLLDFKDDNGKYLIQELIAKAKKGGGYTRYLWDKPSGGISVEKLSYSIALDKWNWMIGTGLYINDIEKGVESIKTKAREATTNTFLFTSIIGITATLAIALIGFLINLTEGKLASHRMKEMTHKTVNFQEDERKRVSRELHDGINQLLVSVSYKLDIAKNQTLKILTDDSTKNISNTLTEANEILAESMQEVRRISRDLRPTLLDDLGLVAAIESLTNNFSERTNIEVVIKVTIDKNCQDERLPHEIETALYRIVQEAFNNIEKHAYSADIVKLKLKKSLNYIKLSICNNGIGFDKETIDITNPDRGLGLRNMQDRAELLEGNLTVNSTLEKGTTVKVNLPL